jgi:succinate dehydrogenase / fumarate reductase flavoprotein subunit
VLDLLIIGSGISALSVANKAKELGIESIKICTKSNPTSALSCMAQGGINAHINNQEDSISLHVEDTLKASGGLANRENVEYLCGHAKEAIYWLDSMGVSFNRDENGDFCQRRLAGSTIPRACYAEDYTGLLILNALYEQVLKNSIPLETGRFLLNFIVEDGAVVGATFLNYNDSTVEEIYAKSVVVATGGMCGIYTTSTNPISSTGDGIAAALRAGAKLSNMEFVQFHPTALKNSKVLISESARGEGGILVNDNNQIVIDALATRDEVSRAVFYEIKNGKRVYLDLRHLGEDKIEHHLPRDREMIKKYQGVDPVDSLVEITPAAHYTFGGIDVDIDCKSSLDGLYAVGECANMSLHGANRLGANSLLDCVVFGIKVSDSVKKRIDSGVNIIKNGDMLLKDEMFVNGIFRYYNQISFYDRKDRLSDLMYRNVGIVKKDMELKAILRNIKQIQDEITLMGVDDRHKNFNQNLVEFLEFMNMLELCEIVVLCSINRSESRGAHFRDDYVHLDDKFLRKSSALKKDGILKCGFEERAL